MFVPWINDVPVIPWLSSVTLDGLFCYSSMLLISSWTCLLLELLVSLWMALCALLRWGILHYKCITKNQQFLLNSVLFVIQIRLFGSKLRESSPTPQKSYWLKNLAQSAYCTQVRRMIYQMIKAMYSWTLTLMHALSNYAYKVICCYIMLAFLLCI